MRASAELADAWPTMAGSAADCRVLGGQLGGGVTLGVTRAGKPVGVHLLRPAPVRVVVVEQAWVTSLLALRATALGARTYIVTQRPAPWMLLVRTVGGALPFAEVVPPDRVQFPPATAVDPLCVAVDGTISGPETGIARGPWHTSLLLLHRLGSAPTSLLETADLILVPQPPEPERDATIERLRLPPAIGARIQRMGPGEVLAVTRSRAVFVTIRTTPAEAYALRSG